MSECLFDINIIIHRFVTHYIKFTYLPDLEPSNASRGEYSMSINK